MGKEEVHPKGIVSATYTTEVPYKDADTELVALDKKLNALAEEEKIDSAKSQARTIRRVQEMAMILERKYEITGTLFLISDISTEIARMFRERGIIQWPHVHDYVPDKYRNPKKITVERDLQKKEEEDYNRRLRRTRRALLEEITSSMMKEHDPNIVRDTFDELFRTTKNAENICKSRGVATVKDSIDNLEGVGAWNDDEEDDDEFDSKKIQKPSTGSISVERPGQPKITELYNAIEKLIDKLGQVKKNFYEFSSDISEREAAEYAQGIDTLTQFFDPFADLKWSKTWSDWFGIEIQRVNQGKHAAAVKAFTMTHKGAKRPLTREQVGDKSVKVVEYAKKIVDHLPWAISLGLFYRKHMEPRIADRKARLGPILSEKA